ncbi:MAG: hypothetical protein VX911_11270 [Candidatus Latescibacterota bacterium]|nr:hypothetical protein [Candidatus Latescibacterota bacterium]
MKNKFLLIGLFFAVPLFFPFIAYAQSGTSTLSHFTTIDCPPIEVSGKVAFEKDCVQGILDQVHQSYTKEIKAEDAPRAGDEAKQRTELYNKCEEDRVRASDMLSSCTASRDQAKVSLQAMEAQMQELIASRDQAKVSLEEKEAQIQELTASRDQANVSLQAMEAQIQDLTARQATLQEANAQLQAAGEGGYQQRAERQRQATLASCQSHFIPRELAPSIVEARDRFCSEIEEATNENLRSEISIRGCYGHNTTLSAGDYTKP